MSHFKVRTHQIRFLASVRLSLCLCLRWSLTLTQLLHGELHWLDVQDRVTFKLVVMVHRCLNGRAPQYLAVHCVPLSSQRHLRSAERNLLHVPRHRLNTYGRAAGLLPLLVRPPGTVFRILSTIRTPSKLLSGAC